MTVGSTQLVTYTSTRVISWGMKAAGAYGLQPYHLHVSIVWKFGSLNLSKPVEGLLYQFLRISYY